MTTTITSPHPPATRSVTSLLSLALQRLRKAAQDGAPKHSYQTALYAMGALLIGAGVVHVAVWLVDGGAWAGPLSWRKPILFGLSLGMSALALGWIQGTMRRRRFIGWLTTTLIGVFSIVEWGLITTQTWRGRPSHFNEATPADASIFNGMAVSIGLVAVGILILQVWAVVRLRGPAPTVIAAHTGMSLLLVGCALGGDLIARGTVYLEENGRVPNEVLIGVAGSGRLAHAVALHSLQVLAVLALLLGRLAGPPSRRTRLMTTAATGIVALAVLVAVQAYAGKSMLELSLAMTLGIVASVALVAAPFAIVLLGSDRAMAGSNG